MATLIACINKHGRPLPNFDDEKFALLKSRAAYITDGYKPAEAERAAVEDAISEIEMERADIVDQITKQGGGVAPQVPLFPPKVEKPDVTEVPAAPPPVAAPEKPITIPPVAAPAEAPKEGENERPGEGYREPSEPEVEPGEGLPEEEQPEPESGHPLDGETFSSPELRAWGFGVYGATTYPTYGENLVRAVNEEIKNWPDLAQEWVARRLQALPDQFWRIVDRAASFPPDMQSQLLAAAGMCAKEPTSGKSYILSCAEVSPQPRGATIRHETVHLAWDDLYIPGTKSREVIDNIVEMGQVETDKVWDSIKGSLNTPNVVSFDRTNADSFMQWFRGLENRKMRGLLLDLTTDLEKALQSGGNKDAWDIYQAQGTPVLNRRSFLLALYNNAANRLGLKMKVTYQAEEQITYHVAEQENSVDWQMLWEGIALEQGRYKGEAKTYEVGTPENINIEGLSDFFLDEIKRGVKHDKRSLQAAVASLFGMTRREWLDLPTYQHKPIEEAFEYAIVKRAKEIVGNDPVTTQNRGNIFNALEKLYNNQPMLATRTSTSIALQAYSTPVHLGFLSQLFAGVTRDTLTSDITAGNGMLLFLADPKNVWANEIDPERRKVLDTQGFTVTAGNAAIPGRIPSTPNFKSQDSMVLNPPFKALKTPVKIDGFKITKLEHLISINALKYLKDDGKAAIIIGGHNFRDEQMAIGDHTFLNWLYHNYNVLANIDIPGEEYARQGTKFPIRLIVIDGRKAKPEGLAPMYPDQYDKVETLPDLFTILEEIESGKRKPYSVVSGTGVGGQLPGAGAPGRPGTTAPTPAGPVVAPVGPEAGGPGAEGGPGGPEGGAGTVLPPRGGPVVVPTEPEAPVGGPVGPPTGTPVGGQPPGGRGGLPAEPTGRPGTVGGENKLPEGEQPGEPTGVQEGTPGPVAPGIPGNGNLGGKGDITSGWDELSDDDIDGLLNDAENEAKKTEVPTDLKSPEKAKGPTEKRIPSNVGRRFINWWYTQERHNRPGRAPEDFQETKGKPKPLGPESHLTPEQKALRDLLGDKFDALNDLFASYEFKYEFKDLSKDPAYINKIKPVIETAFQQAVQKGMTKTQFLQMLFKAYGTKIKPYLQQYMKEKRDQIDKEKKEHNALSKNEYQTHYEPFSKGPVIDETLIPKYLKDATETALQRVVDEVGDLDEYVTKQMGWKDVAETFSRLAADQIDALALMFWNFGHGSGFINGDQVGVGKGRTGAAVMENAVTAGEQPVYVTADVKLFSDVWRDVNDIGWKNWNPFIMHSKSDGSADIVDAEGKVVIKAPEREIKKGILTDIEHLGAKESDIYKKHDSTIATYSQFQSKDAGGRQRKNATTSMVRGNTLILDESQLATGTKSNRGEFFRDVVPLASRVLFMSGTFAKRPELLALYMSRTDLRYLNMNYEQMVEALRRGGTPLMEMLSLTLARAGQLIRREKDYTGITMNSVIHTENQTDEEKRADNYIGSWREMKNLSAAVSDEIRAAVSQAKALHSMDIVVYGVVIPNALRVDDKGKYIQQFSVGEFGKMVHEAVKFYLYAAKSKYLVADAIKLFKEKSHVEEDPAHPGRFMIVNDNETETEEITTTWGEKIQRKKLSQDGMDDKDKIVADKLAAPKGRKPFIAVDNTMEAALNDFISEGTWTVGEPFNPSFTDIQRRFLKKALTIQYWDSHGDPQKVTIPAANLTGDAAVFMAVIETSFKELSKPDNWLPGSPIDWIRQQLIRAGMNVGEITGRHYNADFSKSIDHPILKARPKAERNKGQQLLKFSGMHKSGITYDGLILNRSASTGISAHASPLFKDQRPRAFVGGQSQSNVDDEIQMRGRIMRTGQIALPYYAMAYLPLPMEVRGAAAMLRKEKQVNANTSSNSDSPLRNHTFPDLNNHYGDELTQDWLREHDDVRRKMRIPEEHIGMYDYMSFSSRLHMQPVRIQKEFYEEVEMAFIMKKEELQSSGQWDLETTDEDFQAITNGVEVVVAGLKEDNELGGSTFREEVDILPITKPMTYEEINETVEKNLEKYGADVGKSQTKLPYSYKEIGVGANKVYRIFHNEIEHGAEFFTEKEAENFVREINKAELKHIKTRTFVDSGKVRDFVKQQITTAFETWIKKRIDDARIAGEEFNQAKFRDQFAFVMRTINQFKIGDIYRLDWAGEELPSMRAVLLDYRIQKPKLTNPGVASKITLVFAVNNSLRKLPISLANFMTIGVKLAKIGSSHYNEAISQRNWTGYIEQGVSGQRRERRYILTNNVPQGFLAAPSSGIRMVRFTRDGGAWDSGILLPLGYRPSSSDVSQDVTLNPEQSREAVTQGTLLHDSVNDATLQRVLVYDYTKRINEPHFELRVKTGSKGEKWHQDPALLSLAINNNFESVGKQMMAKFLPQNLLAVTEKLQELDLRFSIPRREFTKLFSEWIRKTIEKRSQKLIRKQQEQQAAGTRGKETVPEGTEIKAEFKKGSPGEQVLTAITSLQPSGQGRALVSITELRAKVVSAESKITNKVFDDTLLALSRAGMVSLHKHDFAASLTAEARSKLLTIDDPNAYIGGKTSFIGVVPTGTEFKYEFRRAEEKAEEYFEGEATEEGGKFQSDFVETMRAVRDSIKTRKEGWMTERPDTSWIERMAASPEWYFQKVPAAWRVYRSALEKNDDYHSHYHDITGQDKLMAYLKQFSKDNPRGYESLKSLLVNADRNEHIWKPETLAKAGYSQEFIDAWSAFRKMMTNGLRKLQEDLRNLIAEHEKRNLPLPSIITWDGDNRVKVNLKVALAMMGKMEGWYFPRMRRYGRFLLIARKAGESPKYEFTDSRIVANTLYAKWKAQGFDVLKQKSKGLPEDVFEVANRTMGLNQIVNSALDKITSKEGVAKAFEDFNLKANRVKIDDKNDEVFITGPTTKEMNNIFKGFGGRWYPKAAIKGWHFLNPPADIEKQILEVLTLNIGIPGEMEELTLFAASIATSIADTVKGRGFRGRMIARGEKLGKDVYIGYEEDPLKASSEYATSVAAGIAKKNMASKMVRAVTGTDIDRENFDDWKGYLKEVKRRRIDANSQKNIYHDVKVYMNEQLRNEQFADRVIGFIKSITILKYLGLRAATAAVNLTSLLTSVPAAMHTYGQIPIVSSAYWLGKGMDAYRTYKWGDREKLDPNVRKMFDELETKGWDQAQLTTEAMGILRSRVRTSFQWLIDVSMGLFAITERLNRVGTIAGSFMALQKQGQDFGASISIAKQISDSAHGVYGKVARPYLAQGEHLTAQAAKSFYVFSKFSHNYLQLAYDVGFRKKDRIALLHMMLAPAILGGVGSTILGPAVMQAFAALVGSVGAGDTPKEGEELFYAWIENTFGHTAMEYARHGLLGAGGAGIAVKGSLAINPVESVPTTLPDFLGAPGNVVADLYYGGKSIYEGDTRRGIEKITPRFVGFPMQALREAKEGITTSKNVPKYLGKEKMEPSVSDTIYRIINFNPAHIAELKERKRAEETLVDKYSKKRGVIYRDIRAYYMQPPDERTEEQYGSLLADIMEYNQTIQASNLFTVKGIPFITKEAIKASLKQTR